MKGTFVARSISLPSSSVFSPLIFASRCCCSGVLCFFAPLPFFFEFPSRWFRFLRPHLVVFPFRTQLLFSPFVITVPKVSILNFCSGFRWTAVLESVQRNPLTNVVTLQSIPLFQISFSQTVFLFSLLNLYMFLSDSTCHFLLLIILLDLGSLLLIGTLLALGLFTLIATSRFEHTILFSAFGSTVMVRPDWPTSFPFTFLIAPFSFVTLTLSLTKMEESSLNFSGSISDCGSWSEIHFTIILDFSVLGFLPFCRSNADFPSGPFSILGRIL